MASVQSYWINLPASHFRFHCLSKFFRKENPLVWIPLAKWFQTTACIWSTWMYTCYSTFSFPSRNHNCSHVIKTWNAPQNHENMWFWSTSTWPFLAQVWVIPYCMTCSYSAKQSEPIGVKELILSGRKVLLVIKECRIFQEREYRRNSSIEDNRITMLHLRPPTKQNFDMILKLSNLCKRLIL